MERKCMTDLTHLLECSDDVYEVLFRHSKVKYS